MKIYSAVAYIRLSYTDDKTVESNSVSNQRKMIEDFVAKHDEIELVAEKVDDGYSGVIYDRPAFIEMMELVKNGTVNCVIVKDLSRLGREYIETGRYLRRIFPAYGVRFIAINDNVDTINDAADDLCVSVKNIMNESYSRDISVKTRSALEIRRKNGEFVNAFTVYGYVKSEEDHNKLVVDEYAANVVKDIFRMRLSGYSALNIAEQLNRSGILSPLAYKKEKGLPYAKNNYADRKDCKWSATTVIRILDDEVYTGTLVQGKQTTPNFKIKKRITKPSDEWIRIANAHEAIISREDYDLVQRIKQIDTRTSPDSSKVYLFSGILICGCCGNRMSRKIKRNKTNEHHYYCCPTSKNKGCSLSFMTKEEDLIEGVRKAIQEHIQHIESLNSIISKISQEQINRELINEYTGYIKGNEKRLDDIREYNRSLYENLVGGIITKEEYMSYKRQYSEDTENLQNAIQEWQKKLDDVLENNRNRNMWIDQFLKYSNMEELSRAAVVQLVKSIRINSDRSIDVTFNYQDEYRRTIKFASDLHDERRAG